VTITDDRVLPPALAEAADAEYGDRDGGGMDWEPFDEFMSAEETTEWIRAWTGNDELDGSVFRVFGTDGTGGFAAFWLVREGRPLAEQPVVFLGSEGEIGMLATDLGAFLWLLAGGFGPREATEYPDWDPRPHPELTEIAQGYAPGTHQTPQDVLAEANREFPDFDETVKSLISY
jgi:hypothetical protein